jgi:hypothetical protein
MDIEGAEYQVIDSIIADCLDISVRCVEFHRLPDGSDSAAAASARLISYDYSLAYREPSKGLGAASTSGAPMRLLAPSTPRATNHSKIISNLATGPFRKIPLQRSASITLN